MMKDKLARHLIDKLWEEMDRRDTPMVQARLMERISALASALGYTFEEVEATPSKIVAVKKGKP